jgi:hypothetical protein
MNGDDIQQKEIGDIIDGIAHEHCAKSCDVHPFMKLGVVKSLRLGESNTKMLRILLIICGGNLLSTWLKGGDISRAIIEIVGKIAGNAIGGQ